MSMKNSNDSRWDRTSDLPIVAQHLNHCATAVPIYIYIYIYKKWNRLLSSLLLLSASAKITIMTTLEVLLIRRMACGGLVGSCSARLMKRGRAPEVKTRK